MRQAIDLVIAELAATFRPRWQERGKSFTFRWVLSTIGRPRNQSFVEGLMARITTEQQVSVTVRPLTEAQRPARIDGEVEFSTTDALVATVVKTGPNSCDVISQAPGVCQIAAVFDADLGAGVRPVEMTGAIEVVEPEAPARQRRRHARRCNDRSPRHGRRDLSLYRTDRRI